MVRKTTCKVACVQMNSQLEITPNLQAAHRFIQKAAGQGAELVILPENVCTVTLNSRKMMLRAFPEDKHPALPFFSELARELKIWILIGSLSIKLPEKKDKPSLANRSFLINSTGKIVTYYDKIHMFDVKIPDGQTYCESALFRPGKKAVLVNTPWGKIGLTTCYDLRFPYLYRQLAQAGASMIAVPAAFTEFTGTAHWHVLVRARAIESGCFILAAAQTGVHDNKRRTYGHSLIVGPWGDIRAEADTDPGIIMADLALEAVETARTAIPSLKHLRVNGR